MRTHLSVSLALGFFLAGIASIWADSSSGARGVIDKALLVMGSEAQLAKFKASVFKTKGKFYVMDQPVEFTGEGAIQSPDKFRETVEGEIDGKKFIMIRAINGDRGWFTQGDKVLDMDKETVAQEMEQLFAAWVLTLVPLKTPAFELTLLGEGKFGPQAVVGVKVYHKGHAGINLYFDKQTALLVKSTMRTKDSQQGGKEVDVDTFYSGYKGVAGVQKPTKFTMQREGKTFFELEFTALQVYEKLDDKIFEKP
jgi:hypothetical protein